MNVVVYIINVVMQLLYLAVIADVILSYILDPYHPVRQFVGSIVNPLLDPIRKVVPNIGMFDISPLILIVLINIVGGILKNIFYML